MSDTHALPEPVALIDPRQLAKGVAAPHCVTRPEYRSWADAQAGIEYTPVFTAEQLRAALSAQAEASAKALEMAQAVAAADNTLHGAIEYWQNKAGELRTDLARLTAERDCRLCANYTTKAGGCASVVQCVDSMQFRATAPRQYWSAGPNVRAKP